MLASDIREMEQADILTRINELEEERFRLKFRSATETLEQPLRLRTVRRDIARCLTILRERELAAAGTEQSPKARRRANRRSDAKGVAKRGTGARRGATKSAK